MALPTGRGGYLIPMDLSVATQSKVADETAFAAQHAEWTALATGTDATTFWTLMVEAVGSDTHLHGLVKDISGSALCGTIMVDKVLVINTLSRLAIPDSCRAAVPDASLRGKPMDWFAQYGPATLAWLRLQGVAPVATTMARPPDGASARGEVAGPDEIAAFLATVLFSDLRTACDDRTTKDDRWAVLLSGATLTVSQLLVYFGLDTHRARVTTGALGSSASDDDKKGSDAARWNKIMCDLKARLREVLYNTLIKLRGAARKTKYTQQHMLAVLDLVIQADYTMFTSALWRFSPDEYVIQAAGTVPLTGKLWDSAIHGVTKCMAMIYGAKIGDGAADKMINFVDAYAAVDLNDACPSYPGGRAAVFADVPGLAVRHEMAEFVEERSTGHATCTPWATALTKSAIVATHESETEDYFRRLRVLTAERSRGNQHAFTCARELQRFHTGVEDWQVAGGSTKKRPAEQKQSCDVCGEGHLTKNHGRQRPKKGGGLKGGSPSGKGGGGGKRVKRPPASGEQCRDFQRGSCARGTNCIFGHGAATNNEVCWGFAKGTCKYGNDCRFSHAMPDAQGSGGGHGGGGRGGGDRGGSDRNIANRGGGGGSGSDVPPAEHKQLYGAGMALIHAAIKASPKPEACVFESFSRHTCSSKELCSSKSKRSTKHDMSSQLSLVQQTKLMKDNPLVRNLFIQSTCKIAQAFRSLCAFNLLEQIDKLGPAPPG